MLHTHRFFVAVISMLAITFSVVRAQTYTGTLRAYPDTVVINEAGSWSIGETAGTLSTASSLVLSGMSLSSTASVISGPGNSGTFASTYIEARDNIAIWHPSLSGTMAVATYRYSFGALERFGTGANIYLNLSGDGSSFYSDGSGSNFPAAGIVEFQRNFFWNSDATFLNAPVLMSLSTGVNVSGVGSGGYDFSPGITFLGISDVRDFATGELITGYSIFSQSGADYNLAAVPEPSTWAAILGGVALVGALLRRSRLLAGRQNVRG